MVMIRSRAPLRISFCGGGTDVSPYTEDFGGVVLSATVDKQVYCSLQPNSTHEVKVFSLDFDSIVRYQVENLGEYDSKFGLAKAVLKRLGMKEGVNIFLHSDAPPGSGLGTSSAVTVSLIGLVADYLRLPMTQYEIAELAFTIERVDLEIQGGRQDQFAAAFGGFNLIEFYSDHTVVTPLRIRPEILNELEYQLMLCYTGRTRLSSGIIDKQIKRYEAKSAEVMNVMKEIKEITYKMKDCLVRGQLYEFGDFLDISWRLKKKMNPSVTDPAIDELYAEAKAQGAIGGKILGAGGGGYLLIFCPFQKKHIVAKALQALGGQIVGFHFETMGLQSWRINSNRFPLEL